MLSNFKISKFVQVQIHGLSTGVATSLTDVASMMVEVTFMKSG